MALNVELLESSFAQIKVNSLEVTKRFYIAVYRLSEVQPLFANTIWKSRASNCFNLSSLPSITCVNQMP